MMYIAGSGTPYWYEWEVGLLECLKMMTDSTIQSVVLQSVDFQSLDDVVVNYEDGRTVNIQVKHSDVGESFTYSTLTNGERSMLKKWADEWDTTKTSHNITEIRIVTNRSWGTHGSGKKCSFANFIDRVLPKLRADYGYISEVSSENVAIDWFKEQLKSLGNDAFEFVKILKFYHEEDLDNIELRIRENVAQILGTDRKEVIKAASDSLLAKLSYWSTSRRESQEITREEIYAALCTDSTNIPDYEIYPEKPIFPSREAFAKEFLEQLQKSDKKVTFVQGLPGSGKTNFVSYLAQLEDSIVDFRFYTYLPVNKEHPSFSDDAGYYTGDLLWRSILTQLKKHFEAQNLLHELKFPLIYSYLSVMEMREAVLKYLPEYAKSKGRTCYLFIDGLDHAARARDARNSFLSQLPLPNEISGDVKIILVGQPINDKYPRGLINNGQIDYIDLPTLQDIDITMLLSSEEVNVPNVDTITLAKSIIEVVGNNALNVLFAVREVKRLQSEYSFDSIIDTLKERNLNSQIDRYYDWIVSSVTEGGALLLKIKTIFAFASQKITAEDIANMCGAQLEDVVLILNELYPLIDCDLHVYYTFHNDVRLYFKESIIVNSNYETVALAIYQRIAENENLTQYKYDISFGMAFELSNKQFIFDLFSPEYIIKSIQYKISVNQLVRQFNALTQLVIESRTLENIDKISIASSTISQYINNIQYNEKSSLLYDDRLTKTESEKYVLCAREKINTIVYDIYSLLKKGYRDRACSIFEEYLKDTTLSEYLNGSQDASDREYNERCGYICRFFSDSILEQDVDAEPSIYLKFLKGWLQASVEFTDAEDISKTFSFKYYRLEILNSYTAKICNEKKLDQKAFDLLRNIYLGANNKKPISSLIDLCICGILNGYEVKELQSEILSRQNEILESEEFEFSSDKILYYIKLYFCLYNYFKGLSEIPKQYLDILQRNHINAQNRGYVPAIDQFNLVKKICGDYFEKNINTQSQIKAIFETVYFERNHGFGSSYDCNAHGVIRFLKGVIFNIHSKKAKDSLAKICQDIKYLFTCDDARYVNELSELFYIAGAKDDYLEIVEHWIGSNGILWDCSYGDVEYIGMDIVQRLKQFGCLEKAEKTEKSILFKLFGYVDHKDYSLDGILECYKLLPLSEDKLYQQGLRLLTISDKASSIGDNRMSGEIETTLFETAASLGIKHVNALFELKNTPEEFYGWRNNFLEVYFKKILSDDFSDSELLALYNIVNAWICEEIESSVRYGYNQLNYLKHYNHRIIEHIKDLNLRMKLKTLGKCEPEPQSDIEHQVVKTEGHDESIVDEICQNGYSVEIEQKIITTFSDVYGSQSKFLTEIGNVMDVSQHPSFVSHCVVEYIIRRRKYGYRGAGLKELIAIYSCRFSTEDWIRLFANIADSVSTSNLDSFYNTNEDLETLCLYYFKGVMPEKLSKLCSKKLDTHYSWITSCGLINLDEYTLPVDDSVTSLSEFCTYQLGKR